MSVVLPVTRITPQNIQAIQVELGPNGQTAGVIAALLAELMFIAGYDTESLTGKDFLAQGGWRIKLIRPPDADQMAYPNDWILVSDATYDDVHGWALQPTSRAYVYGVPPNISGRGTAVNFVNTFTADCPINWLAVRGPAGSPPTPPSLVAQSGLMAKTTFYQPTSANGPFSYVINLTDVTANTTVQVTPAVTLDSTGLVTMIITGLIEGHDYSVTITVSANPLYTDLTPVTSVSSATVTAASTVQMPAQEEAPVEHRGVGIPRPPVVVAPPLSEGLQTPPPITTVSPAG